MINLKLLKVYIILFYLFLFIFYLKKKCYVSRAYAVCWVTPNFWENALTAEKKNIGTHKETNWGNGLA